jgi:hypothetical protein
VSPARLQPVISEVGAEDVVPTSIVIELATPIVDRGTVGDVSSRSVLEIAPPVAGTLRYTSPSTLTFVPARPLPFSQKIRFELKKLETQAGIVEPPAGETWVRELETPPFALLGFSPVDLDLEKKAITLEVRFSGALLPNRARPFLSFTVEGKPAAGVAMNPAREPNALQVVITDPRLAMGARVKLLAKKGLPATIDETLPASRTLEHVVADDKAVVVKHVAVEEGAQGFYLEVI